METTGLARTKSEQLVETVAAAFKSPSSGEGAEGLSRKSSRRMMMMGASPGRSGRNSNSTHIRKSRSAQLKIELDEVSSGAALSRASSASLGLSFSFTGFAVPQDEIADSKPFSDDDDIRTNTYFFYLFIYFNALHFLYNGGGVSGVKRSISVCLSVTDISWLASIEYECPRSEEIKLLLKS